ncbi:MAG: helix-turn-helix domain-containing protein [Phycisphaerae bacterium]|nr:helix-turn-helix domain-containing protein [Phycisphaerae bacterium]
MPESLPPLPPLPPLPSSLASMLGGEGLGGDGLPPAAALNPGQPGGPTPREIDAARGLAQALVECLIAADEGRALRSAELGGVPGLGFHGLATPGPGGIGVGPAALQPLLISGAQAAQRLGVTPRTLRRLSAPSGPIPIVRLGRLIRYAPSDLERAVRSLRIGRETQP